MVAAYDDSPRVAAFLVKRGAHVNSKADSGMTALMNSAWRGRLETVRTLVDAGANVNAQTDSGITALETSRYRGTGQADITRILKEAGARR